MVSWSSLLWGSGSEGLKLQGYGSQYSGLDKHEGLLLFFFMARHRWFYGNLVRFSNQLEEDFKEL